MALLFHSKIKRNDWWREELSKKVPGLEVRFYPDIGDPDDIEFALCFAMPHGVLGKLKNLKAVFSLGAGVDHIFEDPDYPRHVPIARVVDPELTDRMSEYVLQHVLNHHRYQHLYDEQQRKQVWKEKHAPAARNRKVGILGLGALGTGSAETLRKMNFDVAGWSRSPKSIDGVTTFHGPKQLDAFLARTEILVCLLPLTDETTGILNKDLFQKLPEGAALINPGRGPHLNEQELIDALDSGHLSAATLDVFHTEPLPAESPLWNHPRVRVTPHVASIASPGRVTELAAKNIELARAGKPLLNQVDPDKGY
ncbi:2-hydroxyacid dehydrogenase [Sneathiella aquimaris]|uniref:2-hydroxyacid dehydrogenase n=1 Tax=Sneathiella aquimaris TaxID=2599305 RepID=UPI00146DDDC0|nr:glyoxylate/hydroxypyruvate reductase A [Sneathiella aquimaris]